MNLRDFLAPLDSLFKNYRIPYTVIGGYAVAAWGEVRATRDIDLLCRLSDLSNLKKALNEAGLRFEHRRGDQGDSISDVVRIEIGTENDMYEVDVLFGIRDAPAGILERARQVRLADLAVPIASPEDTIILKLLGGSPRDLADATSIVQVQGGRLDLNLIKQLCPGHLSDAMEKLLRAQ
jgi:predicted nucleotidyltransferase